MSVDISSLTSVVLRFAHISFGILWLGTLYFFALVNAPFQKELDDVTKAKVNPALLLRGLYWAKRASLYTMIFGWALFGHKYGSQGLLREGAGLSNRAVWILAGGILATVMWFNVWFLLYPRYRAVLMGLAKGQPPADAVALLASASQVSSFNFYASGPLLFAMIVPNNFPGLSPVAMVAAVVIGCGFWFGLGKRAFKFKPLA
ncbi:MAG: urate hydroxylase PuuD [Deltaproteobacteria bacterium]|nr:urate hydroxylase PuuD [Deltaproteobacteria bacterium]